MKVTNVTLDNFQSYEAADIAFDDGVSLFHGDNGAGKSTILRAIFAGLFQTDMGRQAASGFGSIGELVKRNEEDGGVILTFEIGGDEYELTWTISVDDPDAEEPTGKTKECVLTSPALSNPIDGVTSVRQAIQEEIIGMDARSFTSSVYVQQDEVMRLIAADDGERREIFDDLLGLSRLDDYIERTVELRREAKATRDEAANRRDELQTQLDEEYPDRDALTQRQRELGQKLSDAEDERDALQDRVGTLEDERDALQDRIDNYGDLEDERDALNDEIDGLNDKMGDAEDRIEELDDEIETHKSDMWEARRAVNALDDELDDYDVSSPSAASDAKEQASAAHVEANREETEAEQHLKSVRSDLENAREDVEDLESDLEDLRDDEAEWEAEVASREDDVADAEATLEDARDARDESVAGFLPDEDVSDDISQDTRAEVEARIETLNERRESAGNEATRLQAELDNQTQEVERLEADIEALEAERTEALEALPDDVQDGDDGDKSVVASRVNAAQDAADDIETFTTPQVTPNTLETLRDNTLPEMQAELNEMYADTIDEFVELSGREQFLDERLSEYQTIKRSGECPVCGESVADDNDHHADEHSKVADELGEVQCALVDVRNNRETLEADREAVARVRELVSEALLVQSLAEYDNELATLRDDHTTAQARVEAIRDDIDAAEQKKRDLQERILAAKEEVVATFDTVTEAEQSVTDARDDVDAARDDLQDVREAIEDVNAECEQTRTRVETLEDDMADARTARREATEVVEAAEATLEQVKEATALHETYASHEQAIETKKTEKDNKRDVLDTLRDQRGEKQARLTDIEQELDSADLSDLRDDRNQLDADVRDARDDLQDARDRVDDLQGDIAKVENKLDAYDSLAARISDLDAEMSWAQGVVEEMNALIETYEGVKARLRKENIKLINAYANEVFRELYHSASYERIILNDDYTISLLKSDGTRISPKLSSGGESAIVNIALRAGVYRTIAERNQTASSGLPPFILDEPTTFLDDGHVRELETVIDSIKSWDVSQVLIVSHDESLIDAADYEYEVTKDATTDTSTCTRQNASQGGSV